MTGISIKLDYEMADKIVVEALKDSYNSITSDIRRLKRKSKTVDLEDYEVQDLKDFKQNRKAIKRVICYYTTVDEQKEFFG